MHVFFSILFFGAIFGAFPLILFYGGIYVNYFEFYGIKEYFNGFFGANFNLYFYAVVGLFSGVAFILANNFARYLYLALLIIFSLTFVPNLGIKAGQKLFFRDNARIILDGKPQFVQLIYRDKFKIYYKTKQNPEIIRVNLK